MSRLQFPNGPIGPQQGQPMAVVDVAALQRPMVTPMNDVQVVAMIAARCEGSPTDRIILAEQLVIEAMARSYRFGKKLKAVQAALEAEAKKDQESAG